MTLYTEDIDDWTRNTVRTEEEWQRRRRLIIDDIEDAERRELPVRIAIRWGPPLTAAFLSFAVFAWVTVDRVPRPTQEDPGNTYPAPTLLAVVGSIASMAALFSAVAFAWAIYEMLKVRQDSRWYGRRLRDHDSAYTAREMARPTPEPSTESTEHSEPPTNTGSPTGRWTA